MFIMSDQYSRGILKMVIAQICQMIGWHSINSNPLEFLVDLMQEYLLRLSKLTHQYSEILGRTEANLDDLGLTFQHMHVLIPELLEYVRNVDSVPCIIPIPKFPVARDDHLNFLKPGSHEVVTRPVHVHEHLPAMHPNDEHSIAIEKDEASMNRPPDLGDDNPSIATAPGTVPQDQSSPPSVFKRPSGLLGSEHPISTKRSKIVEEGRPLREIHSVIMTTSGFLSPAREGKLPEPRTPQSTRADSPPVVSSYPMVPPELKVDKKPKKIIKKGIAERKLDKENKKKNQVKELFIPDNMNEMKAKKLARLKDAGKTKIGKSGGSKGHSVNPGSSNKSDALPIVVDKDVASPKTMKVPQTKVKVERSPEVAPVPPPAQPKKEEAIGKLITEPDKQKLNIFKKISKPREEKIVESPETMRHKEHDSRDNPGGVVDNIVEEHDQPNDVCVKKEEKKTPRTPDVHLNDIREPIDIQSPPASGYIFDDMSPPGTPSTPKTPEFSVTVPESKKKKTERNNRKKEQRSKSPNRGISPKKMRSVVDVEEPQLVDRLKTPQPMDIQPDKKSTNPTPMTFPFFAPFPSAPGLIPHPINHSMFTRYPIPMGRNVPGAHPVMPNLPMPPRFMMPNVKPDDCTPPKPQSYDTGKTFKPVTDEIPEIDGPIGKFEKSVIGKIEKSVIGKIGKSIVSEPDIVHKTHSSFVTKETIIDKISPAIPPISISSVSNVSQSIGKDEKIEKIDKINKKSKDHKKEKKDKLKKKKDKKEKYKIKDKIKGKKGKIPKLKEKKDKKDKRKEKEKDDITTEAVPKITLKLNPASPRPPTPDNTTMKKITIKPLTKKPDEEKKRDPSPELAKISALVTRPPKQKVTKLKADPISQPNDMMDEKKLVDDAASTEPGNSDPVSRQVWICPACGNQDDGSPMIGCDDCDAWYHWVCVGVQVPPADHEDWYCRLCIAKKQELHDKKKKKRKKRVKQAHGMHQGS